MSDFATAFPNSRKVYVDGPQDVRVPMREIALSGGEPPLRVYDTSGPQDHDVKAGLPKLREPWVTARPRRRAPARPSRSCTTRAEARSRRRWSSSPSAKGCRPSSSATRSRAAARSFRPTSTTSSSSR